MKITGIWLTKNSEKFIGYSLASLMNVLDHLIVVDSGSTDNTHKIVSLLENPKIQFIVLNEKATMDEAIRQGFRYFDGDVVLLLGDDYIWDNANTSHLREWCERGSILNKRGLLCSVYNLGFSPDKYFSCVKRVFITFQQKNDPLMCIGSFLTDDFDIVHKSETRMKKGRLCPTKIRTRFYLPTPLGFTHWKYLKDTKEYFIHKFLLFQQHIATREMAEHQWEVLQEQKTFKYPHSVSEVFIEYRDKLIPLGGFDIEK